jgi:hypothetical protein
MRNRDPRWQNVRNVDRKRPAIRVTLDPGAIAALDELADASGMSRSEVVETLALSELAKKIVAGA